MGNVTLTYATVQTLVNDTGIAAASAEELLDMGIDALNAEGLTLDNMSGAAGSKTLTVDSKYAGAIKQCAIAAYIQYYKNAGASSSSIGLGQLSESSSSSTGGSTGDLQGLAKALARSLKGRSFQRT